MSLTKEQLIEETIRHELVNSKTIDEAKKEFTCYRCEAKFFCEFAWDLYNINGDCLSSK